MNERDKVTGRAADDTNLDTPALPADAVQETPAEKSDRADGRRRLLRCEKCGASLVTFRADLLRYTREGRPKCCGQTMVLFMEADTSDDVGG